MMPQPDPQSPLQTLDAMLRAFDDLRRIEAQVIRQIRAATPPQPRARPGWPIRRITPG